jgi:hypothetical protein
MRRVLAISVAVLAFVACGGDDDDDDSAAESTTGTDTTATTSAGSDEDCLPVPQTVMDAIASSEEQGVGMVPVEAAAWKSPDFEDVTFIAMRFSATGIEDQVGVWAMNNFDTGIGVTLAVDGTAQQFTVLPDADTTDAAIAVNDPGVDEAKDCLG